MIDRLEYLLDNFHFLLDDFGYKVISARIDREHFGNCIVRFESSEITIKTIVDRSELFIYIGSNKTSDDGLFDLCDALCYFYPEMENPCDFGEHLSNEDDRIIYQVNRFSDLLKNHCSPILKGDLSMEKEIGKIRENRANKLIESMKIKYPQLRNTK